MNLFNYKTASSTWQMASANTVIPTAGSGSDYSASFAGVTDFEGVKFAIGNTGTLPLTMLSFKASSANGFVKLQWETASEDNVKQFVLERSFDGENFIPVAFIAAGKESYSINDIVSSDGHGIQYYRLKIVDVSGIVSGSYLVSVKVNPIVLHASLSAFPNPLTANAVTLIHNIAAKGASAELFSVSGIKLLFQQLAEGSTQTVLNVSALQAGAYFIKINNGAESAVIKVLK